ncbi:unnamed protein product, partial [Durusdinium trenchii]
YADCPMRGHPNKRVVYETLQQDYLLSLVQIQELQEECRLGNAQLVILLDSVGALDLVYGVRDRWSGCCAAIVFATELLVQGQASELSRAHLHVDKALRLKPLGPEEHARFGLDGSQHFD